jgi:hypothetical protein
MREAGRQTCARASTCTELDLHGVFAEDQYLAQLLISFTTLPHSCEDRALRSTHSTERVLFLSTGPDALSRLVCASCLVEQHERMWNFGSAL